MMLSETPIVTTKLGKIKGKVSVASDGSQFYSFQNIPYAELPLNNLRFKAPQPVKHWQNVLDATMEADECYSYHLFLGTPVGSEDCLKLNVYSSLFNNLETRPVMVWIHGGGFKTGSNKTELYGPEYFMCEEIVLVVINYRLGVFGFLSLNDRTLSVPGNAGLKDQVMALKWVHDNISAFGGDPNNVTIFGESAGGASIHYLLCSPMAKGLFHKAIMQSGSALNPWARGIGLPKDFLEYLDLEDKTDSEILEKLMNCSKEELLIAQVQCKDLFRACDLRPFGPVIEGVNAHEPSFLIDDPLKLMATGNYIKVPTIIGYNTHEGMLFDFMEKKYNMSFTISDFKHTIPFYYNLSSSPALIKLISKLIKEFYLGAEDPNTTESKTKLRDLQTDLFFLRGIYMTLKTMKLHNPCPIFVYRFALDANLNGIKKFGKITDPGTCHCDDVFYMFKSMITNDPVPKSIEEITIKRFVKYWTNFALNSNPNPINHDDCDLLNVIWPISDEDEILNIGDKLEVVKFPEIGRMTFWDQVDTIAEFTL